MPRLQIPPAQRQGFAALLKLDASAIDQLRAALLGAPLKLYQFELASAVADGAPGIPKSDVIAIVEALWTIEFLRASMGAPRALFLEDVIDAIGDAKIADVTTAKARQPLIAELMETPALATSAKARSLLADGNSYCSAKILTDIRPIFSEDASEAPKAALVVHHLTLSYHASGNEKTDMIVSLDSDDIDDLMEVLERAKAKERGLHLVMSEAKIALLDSE